MIPLTQVLADISDYLQKRSSVPDEDYQERKKHFNKVLLHLKNKDYPQLLKEIEAGIEEFHHIFTSNRYSDFLSELKKHLVPENSQDAEKRLRKLLVATLKNDTKGIDEALENGSLACIKTPYKGQENIGVPTGTTPVMAAFKTKQFAACAHLLNKLDVIERQRAFVFFNEDEVKPNPIINHSTQYSLLHFAAEYGLTDLLHTLLPYANSFDINAVDANNSTALFMACAKGEEEAAVILLNNKANPNIASSEITPLLAAFQMNNPRLVKELIRHGAEVTRSIYHTVKDFAEENPQYKEIFKIVDQHYHKNIVTKFKDKKRDIIDAEMSHRSTQAVSDNSSELASQLYFENPKKKEMVLNALNECISAEDGILRPLLTIVAIAKTTQEQKPLKTIINDQSDVGTLVEGGEQGTGVYRGKKAVYIAGNSPFNTLGSILHEWKHFVDNTVFGNRNTTFSDSARAEFYLVKESVAKGLEKFPDNTPDLMNIKDSFRAVFHTGSYDKASQDAELLARVPEVIGTLGIEEGRKWLQTFTPKLLHFYENEYNQCCNRYLADKLPPEPEASPSFVS